MDTEKSKCLIKRYIAVSITAASIESLLSSCVYAWGGG